MEAMFTQTGYDISVRREDGYKKLNLYHIKNSDGSLRWIWNANCKTPLILKFYSVTSYKAWFFSMLLKLIFILRLKNIFFGKTTIYYQNTTNKPVFDIEKEWALFTGTVGPNNKFVLFSEGFFYKIAVTEKAKQLLKNEKDVLKLLNNISRQYLMIPDCEVISENIIKTSDIAQKGRRWKKISYLHSWVLFEINKIFGSQKKISEWEHYNNLIKDYYLLNDNRIPAGLQKKLYAIISSIKDTDTIDLALSHGDFTPWNCYISDPYRLSVYDWELASLERSKGFDFFHFIIQNEILVNKKSWREIYKEILDKNKIVFNFNETDLKKYLKFYLIVNIIQNLKIYSDQKHWHKQVYWLLSVWDDALNSFLTTQYNKRELLILDFFDAIKDENYATLKFPNTPPEELSIFSDIDVIMDKKNTYKVVELLKNHSLVHKVIIEKKSFLTQINVITQDLEVLSIDFIHQLKWKNLEIMDVDKLLSHSTTNPFGIKQASEEDTLRYIILFYRLNNAEIPEKYKDMVKSIKLKSTIYDKLLYSFAINKGLSKSKLITILNEKNNAGFLNWIKNSFNYVKDTFSGKGFIITFSGVDGAGKTTVISNMAKIMEKTFRKRVKILRHRPSLLPILSTYTKGKDKAQEDVINSLPRQGKNRSFISSLFRFSYYYTDYLLGQFIVYVKYVMRGYIVIYDRYYFDFIADCKRSNIILPKQITKTGYYFLLKPKYNFFLYADADVILERKKELSSDAIKSLTKDYTNLFRSLRKEDKNKHIYQSVKNENLEKTLKQINDTITYVL